MIWVGRSLETSVGRVLPQVPSSPVVGWLRRCPERRKGVYEYQHSQQRDDEAPKKWKLDAKA